MKFRLQAAFTLIELLVVITIIGILASFALPALQNAQVAAQQVKAINNARGIATSLRQFAADNDGKFPSVTTDSTGTPSNTPITTSNQAFRQLFPTYLTSEQIFYVPKSGWSTKKPDDVFETAAYSESNKTLSAGENHWSYFPTLNDSSNSSLPLVTDSPLTGTDADPAYSQTPSRPGGVWQGKIAIVSRVDTSVEKFKCYGTGDACYILRTDSTGNVKAHYLKPDVNDPNWIQTKMLLPVTPP